LYFFESIRACPSMREGSTIKSLRAAAAAPKRPKLTREMVLGIGRLQRRVMRDPNATHWIDIMRHLFLGRALSAKHR
jgi:hypothetical protein